MVKTKETVEIWGLLRPDGVILRRGYSDLPLFSESAVRSDFSKTVFEQGCIPVLIKKITTTTHTY
jgi:hypothetical protein